MYDRFLKRIRAGFEQDRKDQLGNRSDLFISDYRPLTKRTAEVLVEYNVTRDMPTRDDLEVFARKVAIGTSMLPDTAKHYPDVNAVSFIIAKEADTRRVCDADQMCEMVRDTQYLDARTAEVWNVEDNNGVRVLVKQEKDDIEAILKKRINSTTANTANSPTFRSARAATVAHLDHGDVVEFVHKNKMCTGFVEKVIRSVNGEHRVIVASNNKLIEIPLDSVTSSKTREAFGEDKDAAFNYYKHVFGEDYARKYVYGEDV